MSGDPDAPAAFDPILVGHARRYGYAFVPGAGSIFQTRTHPHVMTVDRVALVKMG